VECCPVGYVEAPIVVAVINTTGQGTDKLSVRKKESGPTAASPGSACGPNNPKAMHVFSPAILPAVVDEIARDILAQLAKGDLAGASPWMMDSGYRCTLRWQGRGPVSEGGSGGRGAPKSQEARIRGFARVEQVGPARHSCPILPAWEPEGLQARSGRLIVHAVMSGQEIRDGSRRIRVGKERPRAKSAVASGVGVQQRGGCPAGQVPTLGTGQAVRMGGREPVQVRDLGKRDAHLVGTDGQLNIQAEQVTDDQGNP
jgi:hypothetical protein